MRNEPLANLILGLCSKKWLSGGVLTMQAADQSARYLRVQSLARPRRPGEQDTQQGLDAIGNLRPPDMTSLSSVMECRTDETSHAGDTNATRHGRVPGRAGKPFSTITCK